MGFFGQVVDPERKIYEPIANNATPARIIIRSSIFPVLLACASANMNKPRKINVIPKQPVIKGLNFASMVNPLLILKVCFQYTT
jgi:hypothetical protein